MAAQKIPFEHMEWSSPQPGVRVKIFRDGLQQLRLLELSQEFVEAEWCNKGHVGFVLSGELEIDFADTAIRFPEGSALLIPAGAGHAHKARAITQRVQLFLVEELPPENCAPDGSVANTNLPTVAETKRTLVSPSGDRVAVRVAIAQPYQTSDGVWRTPVALHGLDTHYREICGEDSLQSLCLATQLVRSRIASLSERGYRLLDDEGNDFAIESYFPTR